MKGLEALEIIKNIQVTTFGNSDLIESAYKEECDIIEKKLKRLDEIENLRTTPNALETCLANYMNKCIDLEKENQELKDKNNKLKKVIDFLKLNFDISLDSKLRIDDGSECVQSFIVYLPENTTIGEMFEILKEVLADEL